MAGAATGSAIARMENGVYHFTVEQYHRLIEAGVIPSDERVELLEGVIVRKMPHNPPHDGTVWLAQTTLLARLPAAWIIRVQSAITLSDSEPEPDIILARGPGAPYLQAHPMPSDIGLIVEVADTTLDTDREIKGRTYARARIPVYWIVNIPDGTIEVYTRPVAGKTPRYRTRQDIVPPASVALILDGIEVGQVPAAQLLPPSP